MTWTLVLFLHLLAAAIWIGGQATLFVAAPVIRARSDDGAAVLGAIGRRFGALAGPALLVLIATGAAQAGHYRMWDVREVREKAGLAAIIVLLTIVHGILGARIARADGEAGERLRRVSRTLSAVNLALGVGALWLAAELAT